MSNKDIKNEYLIHESNNIDKYKDNISIFNLSSLESKQIRMSSHNNFYLDYSKEKSKLIDINIEEPSNINDNKLISEKKTSHINNCFLKSRDDKLSFPVYDLMNDYDSSFAKYFGIKKEQFDILNNNQHKLVLNEFGNIYLSNAFFDIINNGEPPWSKNKIIKKIRFKTQKKYKYKKIKNYTTRDNHKNKLNNNSKIKENYINNKTSLTTKNLNEDNNDENTNDKINNQNFPFLDFQNNIWNIMDKDYSYDDNLIESSFFIINRNYN